MHASTTYTNSSNTPVDLYLTNVHYSSTKGTNGSSAPASELNIDITVPVLNNAVLYNGPVSALVGHDTKLLTGAGPDAPIDVAFSLAQTAGNEWNEL